MAKRPRQQAYCYECAEKRDSRYFEIVNCFGLRLVPFCQRCARVAGKQWEDGKEREAIGANDPPRSF
jgi:hypothetical protein